MSPGLRRLKKRSEYLRVANAGCRWVTPGLVLQQRRRQDAKVPGGPDDGPAPIGVGLTASRKVGAAVARNRARRRLRAVAAEVLPARGRPGHDYVLIARAATLSRAYIDLVGDLTSALAKIGAKAARARPSGDRAGRA